MPQPADVGVEERTDIGDAIFQHGKPVDATAEGVTLIFFRIDAAHGKHAWMHHAGTRQLQPVVAVAERDLAGYRAVAAQVPFDGWFCEGKERRPRPQLHLLHLEERLAEFL